MKRLCLLLVPALLLCTSSVAAGPVSRVWNIRLSHFFGLEKNGSAKPSADALCRAKFGYLRDEYAQTIYNLDPWAQTDFHGAKYDMHPLGLAGKYAFGFYQRTTSPIYAVIFEINLQQTRPQSRIVLLLDDTTNCLLTNAKTIGSLPMMW